MSIANLTIEPHVQAEIMKLVEAAYNLHRALAAQNTKKQLAETLIQALKHEGFEVKEVGR